MRRSLFCLFLCLSLFPFPARADGETVTRGEFLLLVWQSWGGVPYDRTAHPFSDLSSRDDLSQAAGWAYDAGLIYGVGGGLFEPERPITREECAALLRRSDARLGRDTWLPDGAAACNDNDGISPWADDSLYWACITGRLPWLDGRLAPSAFVDLETALGCLCPTEDYFTSFSSSPQA